MPIPIRNGGQKVTDSDKKAVTTSLKVAEYFGKQHKNVIQAIETLDCSGKFRELNFQLSAYTVPGQTRTYPFYEMTRDGFMFVVMGFNGKKAARVKESFIEAFNMMEDRLRNPVMMLPDSEKIRLLTLGIQMEQEKVEALTEQVTEMEPKAVAHDEAMDLGVNVNMTTAAKILGVGPKAIVPLLAHLRPHPGDLQDRRIPD